MIQSKLAHTLVGAAVLWPLTILSWFATHVGTIAGFLACIASIYTVLAGRSARRYWNARHDRESGELTSSKRQESDDHE